MILGFGNNVVSSLASDITASQTTFTVLPGDGPLFASLLTSDFSNKSTTLKNYAKITLTDSGETAFEVCHLTAVSGDTLTVIRGQEGTAAKGWALKDVVGNFSTRGSENAFPQIAHIQSGFYTSGTAGGTANALTLELPTTFFLNGSADWVLKTPIVVYPSQNNTGAATLQLTMGGRVLGNFRLYKGNKAELVANDIQKDVALVCLMDNTRTFFNVANPGAIYAGLGTAAFADLVTSTTDQTAGRVPTVGWMGIGGPEIPIADGTNIYKYFATAASGNYGGGSGLINAATTGGWVGFKWQQHGAGNKYGFLLEQASSGQMALHIYNNASGDMASPEKYWSNSGLLFSVKNPPTAAQTGAMPYFGTALSVDLNTLGAYSAAGIHYQPANAGATAAFHYPVSEAGTLEVTPSAYGCQQEYTTFGTGLKFVRGLSGPWNGKDGPWGPWKDYLLTSGGEVTGTLDQDSVPQATYNQTALSGGSRGGKNCLRKFRGGSGDTIWHETVQGNVLRIATGNTDAEDEMVLTGGVSVTFRGEVISGSANGFRIAYGGYGAFLRNDGMHLYLMLTNKDDPHGNYNALRPLYVDLATGDITIGTPLSVSSTITAAKEVTAGYGGSFGWADQYKTRAPFFNAFATTGTSEFHPVIKQQATVTGKNSWAFSMGTLVSGTELSWHLHMKGSSSGDIQYTWDVNGNFTAPGELIPGKWNNFDNRYQPKGNYTPAGQAYTRAESDGRYNLKNTATKTANSMFSKDASTGVMEVVMSNINVPNKTNVNVTFPAAFPNACVGVVITYNGAGHGAGDDSAIYVPSYSRTGCTLYAHNAEGKFMLIAKGY